MPAPDRTPPGRGAFRRPAEFPAASGTRRSPRACSRPGTPAHPCRRWPRRPPRPRSHRPGIRWRRAASRSPARRWTTVPAHHARSSGLSVELLVEHRLRLAEILRQVGNAGVEHGGRRAGASAACWVAQLGQVNLSADWLRSASSCCIMRSRLRLQEMSSLHRHRLQVGAGDGLIAGVQHLVLVVLGDVHFALDHRNARPLTPALTLKMVPVTATRQSAVAT